MKRKHLIILLSLIFALLIIVLGYYIFKSINYVPRAELVEESNIIENEATDNTNEKLIYENIISPNENFVEQEEDKVFYTIKIYQSSNDIKVVSSSNSAFAKDMSYEIECNNEITENDIKIEWQTIMGDTNFTEENQIAVAIITLSSNGEVISQRKVNFISKAIDIIVDTINKN